ncbi:hypothetical protein I3843_03G220000 [Carya illinoinensis]|nr:hypothetical protein I3843_03G220000 [Carya illinoinensis]
MNLMICDFCLQKKENITPIGLKIVVISTPCLFAFQLLLTHCCWCWCCSGGERSTEDGRWRKSFVSLLDNWIRPTAIIFRLAKRMDPTSSMDSYYDPTDQNMVCRFCL